MIEDEKGENIMNPNSLRSFDAMAEPALADVKAGERFQFFRQGYYIADEVLHKGADRVFNLIVDLKSSWK
jgi:glutaminyl-tRNA synthetase